MRITKDIFNVVWFNGKNILITGGTGTIGNMLVNFFFNPNKM